MLSDTDISPLLFPEAAKVWLEWRTPYRSVGTVANYRSHINALTVFFGELTLKQITAGHLRSYQEQRQVNTDGQWPCPAGASYINHEINTLTLILQAAKLWRPLALYYMPLPLPRVQPRRVMTEEEEEKLFSVIAADPDCYLAYLVASISNNTTATGVELRSVRLGHLRVGCEMPEVEIPPDMPGSNQRVKNTQRARRIPLNETAEKQFKRAIKRAVSLGCVEPDDYLFPKRIRPGVYDPKQPASPSWLAKQWGKLREKTGLHWLRPHDLRHQAITRMLEADVSEETAKAVAGHISRDILQRYSHLRMSKKKTAVRALEPRRFNNLEHQRSRRAYA